jgi:hypothetical protein
MRLFMDSSYHFVVLIPTVMGQQRQLLCLEVTSDGQVREAFADWPITPDAQVFGVLDGWNDSRVWWVKADQTNLIRLSRLGSGSL